VAVKLSTSEARKHMYTQEAADARSKMCTLKHEVCLYHHIYTAALHYFPCSRTHPSGH
jgi:hypothetical protein